MNKYRYRGKIKCADCNYAFRGKMQRKVIVYICGGYHNKRSDCERFVIYEEDLNDVINRHIEIMKIREMAIINSLDEYVEGIEVYGNNKTIIIRYSDGTISEISDNGIKY